MNLVIHFTNNTKTYAILNEGYKLDNSVGAQGKHSTQCCSVQIRSSEAVSLFLTETQKLLLCEIKDGSTTVFEGVVRPYQSVSAYGNKENNLSLEIMDYTEKMHVETGIISYTGTTVGTVITALYNKCSLTPTLDIPSTLSAKTVEYFATESDEYVDEVLESFLGEYGYDYKFEVGYCRIKPTTISAAPSTSIKQIVGTMQVQRSDDWQDGLKTKYQTFTVCKDVCIAVQHYRYDISWTTVTTSTEKSGLYYDEAEHDNETTIPSGKGYINYDFSNLEQLELLKGKNYSKIGVSNLRAEVELEDEKGITWSYSLSADTVERCRFYITYSGIFDTIFGKGWGWNIKIYGDVTCLVEGSQQYQIQNGEKPTEVNLSYLTQSADVIAYNEREYARQKNAGNTYTFKSMVERNAGDFFNLVDNSVTGISQAVRILSCTKGSDGIYSIKAEGANALNMVITQDKLFYGDLKASGYSALYLSTNKQSISSRETVTITASGSLTQISDSRLVFTWYLNNTAQSWTGFTQTLDPEDLATGANVIKLKVTVTGYTEAKEAETTVTLLAAAVTPVTVTEFCYGSATEPMGDLVGYTENNVEYVLSADDIDVSGISWTKSTLPTPTDGRYIWYRVGTYTSPQTESDISNWCVYRLAGEAKEFKLTANEYTYIRNARESNKVNTITLIPVISGHVGTATISVYENEKNGTSYSSFANNIITIPYTCSEDLKKLVCVMTMTDDAGNNLESICILSISDKTGENLCLGVVTQASEVPTTTASGELIDGDYFVVGDTSFVKSGVSYTAGTTYIYNSGVWEEMEQIPDNAGRFLSCLDALKKADVDLSDISDQNTVSWFNTIVADNLYANNIVSRVIQSVGYSEASDGTPQQGYKLDYQGGDESNGQIKSVGGIFTDMDVRGSLNLTNSDGTAGANIVHPSLETTFAAAGDETGVTISTAERWQADDLPLSLSEPYNVTGTYGGVTVKNAVKVTNVNATMYSAQVGSTITLGKNATYTLGTFDYATDVTVSGTRPYSYQTHIFASTNYTFYSLTFKDAGNGTVYKTIDAYYNWMGDTNYSVTFSVPRGRTVVCQTGDSSYGNNVSGTMQATTVAQTFSAAGLTSPGLWLFYSSAWHHHNGPESTRLLLTSPAIDSNNYLYYYSANNFVNYSSYTASETTQSIVLSVPYGITSSGLYYNRSAVTAVFFTRTSTTSCVVTLSDGTKVTMLKDNYYKMYGTIKIAETPAGVKTQGIYPRTADTFNVGRSDAHFVYGYIDHITGTCDGGDSARATKQDITPFTRKALDIINSTDVVNFRYKKDVERFHKGIDDEVTDYIGFIADDTDKSLSGEHQNKMLYTNCIGVLIKAVQELSAEIEKLKGDNE